VQTPPLGVACPETSLLARPQVTDSEQPEFPDFDAHKEWWSQWVDATLSSKSNCLSLKG